MNLVVDGKAVSSIKVPAMAWTDYTVATSIPAGSHTIGVTFTNPQRTIFCLRKLQLDKVTVVASTPTTTSTTPTSSSTPTTTTAPPTTTSTAPPPNPAARIFTGDFSSGNFKQWPIVQTRSYNSSGANYVPNYSAQIINEPGRGNVARFEVRNGDVPSFGGG